jgi:hypothetical protein
MPVNAIAILSRQRAAPSPTDFSREMIDDYQRYHLSSIAVHFLMAIAPFLQASVATHT